MAVSSRLIIQRSAKEKSSAGIPPAPPLSRGEPIVKTLEKGSGEQSEPGASPLTKGVANAGELGDFQPPPNPRSGKGGRLLPTIGPLNRIRPGQPNPASGLMLIGGPSAEYGWNDTGLLKQIHLVTLHQPEVVWYLTTSRRTPAGFIANVDNLGLSNLRAVAHDQVGAGWLPEHLAQSAQVWVTPDSASMVYEALTSGAAVGCFELPYLKPGRVARGLEKLIADKRLTAFTDWQTSGKLLPNTQPLNEAERCARLLLAELTKNV